MLKVLSLCSGIGAPEKALKNEGIPHEIVKWCEKDPYPAKAYHLIHDISESDNLGDIWKINPSELPNYDLLIAGTQCSNISQLSNCQPYGSESGFKGKESATFFAFSHILNKTLPRYFIYENVARLRKREKDWNTLVKHLGKKYDLTYSILDAKMFGLPQSRPRIFVVGIRQDIKQYFIMPQGEETIKVVADFLEDGVSYDYDLSEKAMLYMNRETAGGRNHWEYGYHSYSDGISRCIIASIHKGVPHGVVVDKRENRIRRYTPLECIRLMGFDDSDYEKIKDELSKTRIYKMMGNSMAVPVIGDRGWDAEDKIRTAEGKVNADYYDSSFNSSFRSISFLIFL